jgi:hypothetical protein
MLFKTDYVYINRFFLHWSEKKLVYFAGFDQTKNPIQQATVMINTS